MWIIVVESILQRLSIYGLARRQTWFVSIFCELYRLTTPVSLTIKTRTPFERISFLTSISTMTLGIMTTTFCTGEKGLPPSKSALPWHKIKFDASFGGVSLIWWMWWSFPSRLIVPPNYEYSKFCIEFLQTFLMVDVSNCRL